MIHNFRINSEWEQAVKEDDEEEEDTQIATDT
jgi:hypothetical protein